ncbi:MULTISPECIES: phospho-N-acetylmuramoyl-pentapeptide-transferase [Butyricimonas]|jgi:phospho-N-acetylmuramoyl-pentapeptide-transferase|uniref:Phospho-N-acetylmuramoyl-pentapeptide-transferase n=1 Tax=Butyricimonas faecihominis TaxID=1472416 RepID=A0A7W6MY60_9BACT|nr:MULTISPECIES: phospho-N-acetylmuramoyl-pentapeptide-transferase [Butyricimonas]OKZ17574.1 MAG: phospho-N-acetylmuramoyl-pentapeptide-transferase [Butyricimonas synergistica]KAB1506828.1 phospho-N-acetylmuramoyl-pentapeptide-transferase [Butyricimonas faecihominis]MBB4025712.1 phospho-N-acetylmuramoyl-pentapeptide-transferase [Butyricimonas faecihominis]WOF07666.1 phospho-N-acetylmuramoyl-pentapeptide-transferase [Butyricimonas faecihominis]BEI56279.1 phospho-N-acetylmuramoyl-pentapeptide-tr
MFYHIFDYLEQFDFPGAGMFQYITFRSACAVILSLLIATVVGKRIIRILQKQQVGEEIRDLGLEGQMQKKGTPTMGGVIILLAILVPVVLFARLDNVYIQLMIVSTIWLGLIGFLDDYIKVFRKHKEGLKGRFKVIGQVGLGLIVGVTLYVSDDVLIREKVSISEVGVVTSTVDEGFVSENSQTVLTKDIKSTKTTIPFFKNNEFDYAWFGALFGDYAEEIGWIVFIIITIVIVTAVSNGANLTDGLDGLATGTSAIVGATLGILAYVSGNMVYADYLNIMYIPHSGELVVFIAAFIGATIGFLWYNSFPAQVFMGDTGSLSLGGIIAVFAIMIHKELLIPILCGIFLVENLSVMMQVSYFKYTKKKFGEGRRIFLMSPLHHHFQKKGIPEPKIVTRFWIVGIALAVITIVTLKIR